MKDTSERLVGIAKRLTWSFKDRWYGYLTHTDILFVSKHGAVIPSTDMERANEYKTKGKTFRTSVTFRVLRDSALDRMLKEHKSAIVHKKT